MTKIPGKISTRLSAGLKRFQPILTIAKSRDINESDTVVLVTDILSDVLGYDKYVDITSEHMIRSTFCDLAVTIDSEIAMLIEVKAIGLSLKDSHVKQAVDYAANKGCEWVVLTNGLEWRIYKVHFNKPIENELVAAIDLCSLSSRKESDLQLLWVLSKEGWQKSRLSEYAAQQQALSRFTVGAILMSEPCLSMLKRELRRVTPDAKIELNQLLDVLTEHVMKRDVLEGDKAAAAKRLVSRASSRTLRKGDGSVSPGP